MSVYTVSSHVVVSCLISESSWDAPERLGTSVGASSDAPGRLGAPPGTHSGSLGSLLGPSRKVCGPSGASLGTLGRLLETPFLDFRIITKRLFSIRFGPWSKPRDARDACRMSVYTVSSHVVVSCLISESSWDAPERLGTCGDTSRNAPGRLGTSRGASRDPLGIPREPPGAIPGGLWTLWRLSWDHWTLS